MDNVPEVGSIGIVQNESAVEHTIHRSINRMKCKNCGAIATKASFIIDATWDKYGDDIILPLTSLEGTMVAVPNMQKEFIDCEIS